MFLTKKISLVKPGDALFVKVLGYGFVYQATITGAWGSRGRQAEQELAKTVPLAKRWLSKMVALEK